MGGRPAACVLITSSDFLVHVDRVKLGIPVLAERGGFILVLVFCFEMSSRIHLASGRGLTLPRVNACEPRPGPPGGAVGDGVIPAPFAGGHARRCP